MRVLLAAGVLLLLSVGLAGATTLVELDFDDLVRQSDGVVIGTVTDLQSFYEDSGTFIHTEVSLSVERYLRGDGPAQITLRTPGGQVGAEAQLAHGAPSFELGERVLVFLTTWEDGTAKVLGYAQGKSRLIEDHDGRLVLRGGRVDGRSLDGVLAEMRHGPDQLIPLRPVR